MRNCLVTLGLVLAPVILSAADVSGTWKVDGDVQGHAVNFSCVLAQEAETLSGTAKLSDGTEVPVTGTSSETTVSFEFDTADGAYHLVFSGAVGSDGSMKGTIAVAGAEGTFTAVKQAVEDR
jgi:hypothetical protein